MRFKLGDKVHCNGNNDARIIAIDYWDNMYFYTIRLWDNMRLVGETQMGESSLLAQQPNPNEMHHD